MATPPHPSSLMAVACALGQCVNRSGLQYLEEQQIIYRTGDCLRVRVVTGQAVLERRAMSMQGSAMLVGTSQLTRRFLDAQRRENHNMIRSHNPLNHLTSGSIDSPPLTCIFLSLISISQYIYANPSIQHLAKSVWCSGEAFRKCLTQKKKPPYVSFALGQPGR